VRFIVYCRNARKAVMSFGTVVYLGPSFLTIPVKVPNTPL
jgi:hypothetical protein